MSNNNSSYQKYDGNTGTYTSADSSFNEAPRGKQKWLIGAVIVAAVGIVYGLTFPKQNSQQNIDKVMKADTSVDIGTNGKLKLFDDLSKLLLRLGEF
jgi:hypothetical protein